MIMFRNIFVSMSMSPFTFCMNMGMGMNMFVLMCMYQITMTMLMCMYVYMLVGVLQFNGVFDHQNSSDDHNHKANIKLNTRSLIQQKNSKENPQKWCNRLICTGLCSTQIFLCFNIEVNA